jgi:predicted permease
MRYAFRALRASPGFTATVVLVIGLSVGGFTSGLSAVRATLLKPLRGVTAPERLVWLTTLRPPLSRPQGVSYPDFIDYRDGARGDLAASGAYESLPVALAVGTAEPQRLRAHLVAGEYFATLGVVPKLGRFFSASDVVPGSQSNVAILGHDLWMARFGGDSAVTGRNVQLNGHPFTVVGVAPPGFAGPELGAAADLWVPLGAAGAAAADAAPRIERRDGIQLRAFARLTPGTTAEGAGRSFLLVSQRLATDFPATHERVEARALPFRGGTTPDTMGDTLSLAALLLVVGGLIVAIACFNLANLFLARYLRRTQELGIRLALGASRARLAGQLAAESLMLAIAGGVAGVLVSLWTGPVLASASSELRALNLDPDLPMLGTAVLVSLLAALVFGVGPAMYHARRASPVALGRMQLGEGPLGRRPGRLQPALIVAQLAVSLVLLFGSGQFLATLQRASAADLGFDARGVTLLSYDLSLSGIRPEDRPTTHVRLRSRIAELPSVAAVGITDVVPLSGIVVRDVVEVPEREGSERSVSMSSVSPGYFAALGVRMTAGREFADRDDRGAAQVAIVNATAAEQLWPGEPAIGKRLRSSGSLRTAEVVGVASDSKYDEPTDSPTPFVYIALAQRVSRAEATLVVRGKSNRPIPIDELKGAIREMDPRLTVFDARSMGAAVRDRLDRQRGIAVLLGLGGALAVVIAALGLYGVMGYHVSRRSREIGIRLALGATPGGVERMILRQGVRLCALGVAAGSALAVPMSLLLSGAVFGLASGGVGSLLGAASALTLVALAASYLPARRAARAAPLAGIRDG